MEYCRRELKKNSSIAFFVSPLSIDSNAAEEMEVFFKSAMKRRNGKISRPYIKARIPIKLLL